MDSRIKSYALKLLSKRDYFEEELKQKLLKKGFDKEKNWRSFSVSKTTKSFKWWKIKRKI